MPVASPAFTVGTDPPCVLTSFCIFNYSIVPLLGSGFVPGEVLSLIRNKELPVLSVGRKGWVLILMVFSWRSGPGHASRTLPFAARSCQMRDFCLASIVLWLPGAHSFPCSFPQHSPLSPEIVILAWNLKNKQKGTLLLTKRSFREKQLQSLIMKERS